MKIVVLGGGGFVGSTIVDHLLRDGHTIRIFERPRVIHYRKFSEQEKVEWVEGDFASSHEVSDALIGMDAVLHLVSTTLPKSSNEDPVYDVQTNVIATLQLLNAMVLHKVRKILFISSGGTVYGNPVYTPLDEKHPTEPIVSYGITKLAIEKYLHVYHRMHGIQAITLRVANPYGERQRYETAQGAVGVFLHHALKGIPIDIWGDGSVTRDYIYSADVASAFVKALSYTGPHSVFNVSSGTGLSLNALLELLESALGRSIVRRYLPGRPFDVPVSVLSNDLARQELGWSPATTMAEGIARTARWMADQLAQ
ncbi:MAG: NAD-dependent epimerase/dehydratase family protein [Comamonadaceae bacterium]